MENARLVFDKTFKARVFLWNVMIREYVMNGPWEAALSLYYQMHRAGVQPDNFTFSLVLKGCAGLSALQEGKEIHGHIVKYGLEPDAFVATALLHLYAKKGSVEVARQVFDKMSKRDVASWNAMIGGYAQIGHARDALTLFNQMQLEEITPSSVTMVSVLQACAQSGVLQQDKWIHDYIIRNGFESNVYVGNSLVAMYAKCKRICVARQLFDKMSQRTVVSWNAMIAGYALNGHANEALTLFYQMLEADLAPDVVTMEGVLQACALLDDMQQGKCIHDYIIRNGFESNVLVRTALIDMYAKCNAVEIAKKVFDRMSKRDIVSWNAMIAGYSQNAYANEALALFQQMVKADVTADSVTMVSVLQACAHLQSLQQGKWVHAYIVQSGFASDVSIDNSLVAMYAKSGQVEIAHMLFDKMPIRNVVSWNAMIAGHAQNGHASEALTMFRQMHFTDVTPDCVTVASVLPACAYLATVQQGKQIHGYIIRSGFELDIFVMTALIDMYAKCGSIEIACNLFNKMDERNVVLWNAMIAAYAMHGHGEDALALFAQMQQTSTKPNHITFICVLSACSHAGLVNEGWRYFNCMSQHYGIMPRVGHYACMVDLLGRAGHLEEAQDFIENMPLEPDGNVWGALLGACRICCNIELGERVAEVLFELEPDNVGYYVLLSNIYAAAGRWDDVQKVRNVMKDRRLKKIPGCSLIEVNNTVHTFLVGDTSHPQSEKIYATLETLACQMEVAGYIPDTNSVLHNVEEEVKEDMLCSHSEKLAIAFGLINTSPGTPIRITKNLRVCGDCHNATKFISKIAMREIIVRDANRFHHFKDGLCSCRDYW